MSKVCQISHFIKDKHVVYLYTYMYVFMYMYFSCLEDTCQKLNDVTSLHVRCVVVTDLQVTVLHLPYIIECNGHVF